MTSKSSRWRSPPRTRKKVLSTFGSRHRVVRKNIILKELVPLKEEEITDPVVKHQVGGAK
jgi:ribosomal protein L20A (L18A)